VHILLLHEPQSLREQHPGNLGVLKLYPAGISSGENWRSPLNSQAMPTRVASSVDNELPIRNKCTDCGERIRPSVIRWKRIMQTRRRDRRLVEPIKIENDPSIHRSVVCRRSIDDSSKTTPHRASREESRP